MNDVEMMQAEEVANLEFERLTGLDRCRYPQRFTAPLDMPKDVRANARDLSVRLDWGYKCQCSVCLGRFLRNLIPYLETLEARVKELEERT